MAKFRSLLRATFICPANLLCLRVMQGEALKSHSVCSRFVLTPGLSFIRLWPSTSRQWESIKQRKNPQTCFACPQGHRKKIYLALALAYSAFLRGPEIKIFLVFDSTSFPVGRPSRVGRALGALILKPGLE